MKINQPAIAHAEAKTIVSKPDKSKWKKDGVWHEIKSGTLVLGPPKDHTEYPNWLKRAQKQAKGQPLILDARNAANYGQI